MLLTYFVLAQIRILPDIHLLYDAHILKSSNAAND